MSESRPRQAQSIRAEANFRARLAELGAQLIEPQWLGAVVKHHVRCGAGHDCYTKPSWVQSGQGICKTCAGHDPADAERRFRLRLAELGAELLGTYHNTGTPVLVRCLSGHESPVTPASVNIGRGVCVRCAGKSPLDSETRFRAKVIELGGTPLFERWLGVSMRHHVRCAAGHDAYPYPGNAQKTGSICAACAGHDPKAAEANFLLRLSELGATPLYRKWLGVAAPHRVLCRGRHIVNPWPSHLKRGTSICQVCSKRAPDVFYVVKSDSVVKFGITSGDARPRLRDHALTGHTEVVKLATGLPGSVALDTENAVKSALAVAGEKPLQGKEYFPISCLSLILDVADSWLAVV